MALLAKALRFLSHVYDRWVQKHVGKAEYGELAALFVLLFMASGIGLVPLSAILDAHQLQGIKAWAYATSASAAIISPLIFGAMADRHVSPVIVLRWLAVASAAAMALVGWSIQSGWSAGIVLALIQIYALCAAPVVSISTTIIFSRLGSTRRQFGPIRAAGTFGWAIGCWLISGLRADTSVVAQYTGAIIWLGLAAYTFLLPCVPPLGSAERLTLKQRMGWDALVLFKNPDHRVVFITAALFSIPMAAFYSYTPTHLRQLGFQRVTAWMTLGQAMEIVSLLAMGALLVRWRLKWIFLLALGAAVPRFFFCASNERIGLIAGSLLHGLCYALYFITAQIYLDERVESAWRGRAQALMSLMNNGVGNLAGYLGAGWWFSACTDTVETRWPLYWGGLGALSAGVAVYFLCAYRGVGAGARGSHPKGQIMAQEPTK